MLSISASGTAFAGPVCSVEPAFGKKRLAMLLVASSFGGRGAMERADDCLWRCKQFADMMGVEQMPAAKAWRAAHASKEEDVPVVGSNNEDAPASGSAAVDFSASSSEHITTHLSARV